jgi:hypothetical protein
MRNDLQFPKNWDYRLGLVAGKRLAQRDMSLDETCVEVEALEAYERAIQRVILVRSEYMLGFRDGYTGYIAGII